jgi:hypothetical protein
MEVSIMIQVNILEAKTDLSKLIRLCPDAVEQSRERRRIAALLSIHAQERNVSQPPGDFIIQQKIASVLRVLQGVRRHQGNQGELGDVCCKIKLQKVAIKNPESCSEKST